MKIDSYKNLKILTNRLLPEKFKGTTYETLVNFYLEKISKQYNYINFFTNRFDIDKIETSYSSEEVDSYVQQYSDILYDILHINYPNLVSNGYFSAYSDYWKLIIETDKNGVIYKNEFTGQNSGSIKGNNFLFNMNERYFYFYRNSENLNIHNYLIQEEIFGGSKTKFNISFDVDYISSGSQLNVYAGVKESYIEKLEPNFKVSESGSHSFRIQIDDPNEYFRDSKLIFKFNGDIRLKNIIVNEYDRIEKEDIQVLAGQLVQNKGRKSLYSFLFNMLTNLGDSNTDTVITINENETVSGYGTPRISISEYESSTIKNIRYGDYKTEYEAYKFGEQSEYEAGKTFKSYITTYNSREVVPFVYKIEATFSQEVFKKYILPITHPVGWKIDYNVYKLIEAFDRYNVSNASEIDSSKYTHYLFVSNNNGVLTKYDWDTLEAISESDKYCKTFNLYYDQLNDIVLNTKELVSQNLYFDTVSEQTETMKDIKLETLSQENVYLENSVEEYKEYFTKNIDYDQYDSSAISLSLYYVLVNDSLCETVEYVITSDITSGDYMYSYFDPSLFLEQLSAIQDNLENYSTGNTSNSDNILDYTTAVAYGDFYYDEGGDFYYSENGFYYDFENDVISINSVINYNYTSEQTANLVSNTTIVKKIVNYGNGYDNDCYLYTGTNSSNVLLSTQNFNGSGWFNLSKRVPA